MFDPNPTEVLLNFLTDEDCLVTKNCSASETGIRKRVWARSNADTARVYDNTELAIYFDWADKSTAESVGNKVLDATGGRAPECKR